MVISVHAEMTLPIGLLDLNFFLSLTSLNSLVLTCHDQYLHVQRETHVTSKNSNPQLL